MLRSKTGSALVTSSDPIIISQNGSPKGQASPAQSLLTLPTVDPPTNSSNLEPEVTSVLNGESDLKKKIHKTYDCQRSLFISLIMLLVSPVISYYSYGFCSSLYLKNENVRAVHISLYKREKT